MSKITASQIKEIQRLREKSGRLELKKYFAEGERTIKGLLDAGAELAYLTVDSRYADLPGFISKDISVFDLTESDIRRIKLTRSFPGIAAVVLMPETKEEWSGSQAIALNRLSDPGNLGTLVRTALWFGIKDCILDNETVDPYNEKVVRASAGAIAGMHFHPVPHLLKYCSRMKNEGFKLFGADLSGSELGVPPEGKNILLLGNEANGLDPEVLSLCDRRLTIPGSRAVESLNVSVAGGILLYWLTSSHKL